MEVPTEHQCEQEVNVTGCKPTVKHAVLRKSVKVFFFFPPNNHVKLLDWSPSFDNDHTLYDCACSLGKFSLVFPDECLDCDTGRLLVNQLGTFVPENFISAVAVYFTHI